MTEGAGFERFDAETLDALRRGARIARARGAAAIEAAHIREALEGADGPDCQPAELWTRDAKRILELSFRYSLAGRSKLIRRSDLELALFGRSSEGEFATREGESAQDGPSSASPGVVKPRMMRVLLPAELAEDLIGTGDAVRPFVTRGAQLGEVMTIGVDAINTGAALVSITLALKTLRRLATATLQRRRPTDPDEITITVKVADRTETLQVDRRSPKAEGELLDFLLAAVDAE
ncbi:MAG TPA: hypothetical protein VGN13_09340 [Solirubrobacteraceae bacterium]|jgi:hypothetical protein